MIQVTRRAVPASLDGPQSAGGKETAAAIAAQKNGGEIDFKAYKGEDVVAALREMFNKKCAYCEFNYAAGGPEDVEHFRPKGAIVIKGKMKKPGYFWLAAEWTNLVPSCVDCNRKRTKQFVSKKKAVSGKANLFPVADEEQRWRGPKKKNKELALLINPCDENPADHLEFIQAGLVRAALIGGQASDKGATSIEIYGLLRADLVEQRQMKETRIRTVLELALEASQLAQRATGAASRQSHDAFAKKLLAEARTHLEPKEPYLAMARAVFREFGLATN